MIQLLVAADVTLSSTKLWIVKKGAWYGFPDYVAGLPITDEQFRSSKGPRLEFVMAEHPPVEKPALTLPPHTGGAKFDLSRGRGFGQGQVYVGLIGDMTPATGEPTKHPGFSVVRIDLKSMKVVPFLRTKAGELGPQGFEYVATAGLKRPVDVKFSPDGSSLYIVDLGAMAVVSTAIGPSPLPFPTTGVIWRASRTAGTQNAVTSASRRQVVRRVALDEFRGDVGAAQHSEDTRYFRTFGTIPPAPAACQLR